jgi:low affinity Fe/Cu permease
MVFSIQNTQYRDSKAIQLKLNELIAADKKARDSFIGLESLTDEELAELDKEFQKLLSTIEGSSPLHKLHHSIKQAQTKRPSFYQQAGHLVDQLIKTVE